MKCPVCGDAAQQESVGQIWGRPLNVCRCRPCDKLYLASLDGPELAYAEQRLLSLTAAGLTVEQIAQALDISVRTVNIRRVRLRQKFAVGSNAELIRLAAERGLV